jgi:hypothetical protein
LLSKNGFRGCVPLFFKIAFFGFLISLNSHSFVLGFHLTYFDIQTQCKADGSSSDFIGSKFQNQLSQLNQLAFRSNDANQLALG